MLILNIICFWIYTGQNVPTLRVAVTHRVSSGHYVLWFISNINGSDISRTEDEDELWVCAWKRASPPKCTRNYVLTMPVVCSLWIYKAVWWEGDHMQLSKTARFSHELRKNQLVLLVIVNLFLLLSSVKTKEWMILSYKQAQAVEKTSLTLDWKITRSYFCFRGLFSTSGSTSLNNRGGTRKNWR